MLEVCLAASLYHTRVPPPTLSIIIAPSRTIDRILFAESRRMMETVNSSFDHDVPSVHIRQGFISANQSLYLTSTLVTGAGLSRYVPIPQSSFISQDKQLADYYHYYRG